MSQGHYARFVHDCEACSFVGQFGAADLYYCSSNILPTVIARHSDRGGDYSSGMAFSYGAIEELGEARRRAQAQGLVQYALLEALHSMREDAPEPYKVELREHLTASDIGRALMLQAQNAQRGSEAVQVVIEELTASYQKRYPDKPVEYLRDWAETHVCNAHRWLSRLGLPHVPRDELLAMFEPA